jgi:hypothetical protein
MKNTIMIKTIKLLIILLLFSSNYACKRQHTQSNKLSAKDTVVHTSFDTIVNNWYSNGGKNKDSLLQLLYEAGAINADNYFSSVSSKKKSEIKIKLYGKDREHSSSKILMNRNDYSTGILSLEASFDSIKDQLGIPDSTNIYEGWNFAKAYYYPKLVVWVDNNNHHILTLDIYDSKYSTNRGLKIGDSLSSVEKLYPRESDIRADTFNRSGPFDDSFKEYSEWRLYDNSLRGIDGWVLIIFIKNNLVVKMLFYVSMPD